MKFILLALLTLNSVFAQEVKRKDLEVSDKKVILEVLNKNDELFNAFLAKDGAKIEKISSELHAIVGKAPAKLLVNIKKNSKNLLNIKSKNSHETNLAEYEIFLQPVIEVVKSYNVGDKFNVFYCPMVKKSWIQNVAINKEVRNVYAMEMLECGSQETNF